MFKKTSGTGNWFVYDVLRGFTLNSGPYLVWNDSAAEANSNRLNPTSTGVKIHDSNDSWNESGATFIYMAIRRGSLNTPENATDVFDVDQYTGGQSTNTNFNSAGFPADMLIHLHKIDNVENTLATRLTDGLFGPDSTAAEVTTDYVNFDNNNGWVTGESTSGNTWRTSSGTDKHVVYAWKRAPSYFDVVAYSGTGSATTVAHNLGVAPEMMWVKKRSGSNNWKTFHANLGGTKSMELNTTVAAETNGSALWNSTAPTASVFSLGSAGDVNSSSHTYIAYLFATLEGVSKVGSYTGTGSDQNIDCGFSNGARFVLIKNTSAADNWPVFDSTRGIVAGNDSHLSLNNPHNEASNSDYIDPHSSGFAVAGNDIMVNGSGSTYIFYAIA